MEEKLINTFKQSKSYNFLIRIESKENSEGLGVNVCGFWLKVGFLLGWEGGCSGGEERAI